jgi:hypothetical protein
MPLLSHLHQTKFLNISSVPKTWSKNVGMETSSSHKTFLDSVHTLPLLQSLFGGFYPEQRTISKTPLFVAQDTIVEG